MKKILFTLCLAAATLVVTSGCTKEYITNQNFLPGFTMVYKVNADQWEGTFNQAYHRFAVPELTDYFVKQGIVTVAYSDDGEKTYKSMSTVQGQAFSYKYGVGFVEVRAEDPVLGDYDVELPAVMHFKITLTEADFVE